jgi:haloalkane dehalogenase
MVSPATFPDWVDRVAYPFTWRHLDLTAGRMHYVDEGHGPVILFVHGTPTWSFDYRHLIQELSPHYRCVAPDLLGFGLSERPATFPYTPEAHAAVLREFVDRLELQNLTLVVHDFGGPIGLSLCFSTPSPVRRVVLINTWMWSFDDDPSMTKRARIAEGALGRWLYAHANFSLRVLMPSVYGRRAALTPAIHRQSLEVFREKSARTQVLHALARALNGSAAYYADLWAHAPALRNLEALIVWGMKDSAFRPYLLDRWTSLLPHATVLRLAESGHWPHEEQPAEVAGALSDWLSRTEQP